MTNSGSVMTWALFEYTMVRTKDRKADRSWGGERSVTNSVGSSLTETQSLEGVRAEVKSW